MARPRLLRSPVSIEAVQNEIAARLRHPGLLEVYDLGEHNGYLAQTTSVPGVAQRTGATIYYVELFPQAQAQADGAAPVLALMPLPGDVDIVLASELMEAGRAVQRGLVTPERTTALLRMRAAQPAQPANRRRASSRRSLVRWTRNGRARCRRARRARSQWPCTAECQSKQP